MGIPEFSRPLADYNQEQIDEIQAAVSEIGLTADEIQALVTALQDTDMAAIAADVQTVIGNTDGLGTSIGSGADVAGQWTLFARLQQLREDLLNNIGVKIGSSGAETLFQVVKGEGEWVRDHIDAQVVSRLGSSGDGAGHGSLFAKASLIGAYVDEIETRLGSAADVSQLPTAINSLFGWISFIHRQNEKTHTDVGWGNGQLQNLSVNLYEVRDYVTDKIAKITTNYARNAAITVSPVSGTWYTVVNVAGRGVLNRVGLFALNGAGNEIRITVDGDSSTVTDNNARRVYVASGVQFDYHSSVSFDSSLVVEVRQSGAAGTSLLGAVDYGLF